MDGLKDRNARIADSRTTSHNTLHVTDLCDMKEPLQKNIATVGTGAKVVTTKVGTIKGSIYDKFGNIAMNSASLKDEVVVPGSKINLLRIPVFLEKGHQFEGNA